MTVKNTSLVTNIHTHSLNYDQHNTSHSFWDLYYEINQVCLNRGGGFHCIRGTLACAKEFQEEATILNIISLRQVLYCQISDLLLHFLVRLMREKQARVTPILCSFPV